MALLAGADAGNLAAADKTIPLLPLGNAEEIWKRLPDALAGKFALFPLAPGAKTPQELPSHVPVGTAVVIQTSGSTAQPKRVMLSAEALLSGAAASAAVIGSGRWLMPLPAHYIAGFQILVRSYAAGTEPIMLNTFDVDEFFDVLGSALAEDPDAAWYTSLVPNQLLRLIEACELDQVEQDSAARQEPARLRLLQSFHTILIGGQALPESLAKRAASLNLNIVTTYGSSETAGGCLYDGIPLPGVEVRVHGGLLEIAGAMLASGYVLDPEQTASRFVIADGTRWYLSADRAQLHEGQVIILGRNDDIYTSGGVKVSLNELNEFVKTLPGLANAEAVTMPDGRWGTVAVVAADGRTRMVRLTLEQLRLAVSEKLGEAAAPRQLIYFDEGLPLLDSGKPDILRIRQEISEEPRERS